MLTPDAERAPAVLSTNFYWHLMAAFRSRVLCDCVLTLFMVRPAQALITSFAEARFTSSVATSSTCNYACGTAYYSLGKNTVSVEAAVCVHRRMQACPNQQA